MSENHADRFNSAFDQAFKSEDIFTLSELKTYLQCLERFDKMKSELNL